MSFFILCDGTNSKDSINVLSETIQSAGYKCETSFDKKEMKDHLSATYMILFLTKKCLRDKNLVNKFVMALSRKKKYCLVYEADESKGAQLSKGDLPIIDLNSIIKDPKSLPKARKMLGEVSAIPFRANKVFADFCVQRIFHNFCLKPLKEYVALSSSIDSVKITEDDLSKSVKEMFENLEKAPKTTKINFIGCEQDFSEFLFSNKLLTDLKQKIALAVHRFDRYDVESINARLCLNSIAQQLFHQIPDFNFGFTLPQYTVEQHFKELFEKPCKKILRRKQFVFIIIRNIHHCESNEANSLVHLFQNCVLPKWLRVIITGSKEFCNTYKLDKPTINLVLEENSEQNNEARIKRFSAELNASIDPIKLIGYCSLSRSPIPISILSRITKQDLSSLSTAINKHQILEVISNGTDESYLKFCSYEGKLEVSAKELLHILRETIASSKVQYEIAYAFKEVIYQAVDTDEIGVVVELLNTPDWMYDRLRFGVGSLISQIRYTLRNIKGSNPAYSTLYEYLMFLQNSEGVLYRDYREYKTQALGNMMRSLTKNTINDIKALNLEGVETFIPLKETLKVTSPTLGNVSFDSYIDKRPYTRVVVSILVEEFICCGTDEGEIIVYSADKLDFKRIKAFKYHNRKIVSLANEGDLVLSTSEDATVTLFSVRTGKLIHAFEDFNQINIGGVFHDKGFYLATKGCLKCYNASYKEVARVNYQRASTVCKVFCTDNKAVAIGFSNGSIALSVQTDGNLELETLSSKAHSRGVVALSACVGIANILVSTGFDRKIKTWNLENKTVLNCFQATIGVVQNVLLTMEHIMTSTVESNIIEFYSLKGEKVRELSVQGFGCESMCDTGENTFFISGTNYLKHIVSLDSKTSENVVHHKDWIKSIAVSTNSSEVATGDISGCIVVWDSNTGEHKRVLQCESYVGNLFVFSIDGKYLLSRVGAWDAQTGLRVPYMTIDKSNRHPLKADFEHEKLGGYLNLVENEKGVCFSSDSADSLLRAKLPQTAFRKKSIAVCCSGRKVHFLEFQ